MEFGFEVVSARRPPADAPAQVPMRPEKIARNPDTDSKKARRQQARQQKKGYGTNPFNYTDKLPAPTEACPSCGALNDSELALDDEWIFICSGCGAQYGVHDATGTVLLRQPARVKEMAMARRTAGTLDEHIDFFQCPQCGASGADDNLNLYTHGDGEWGDPEIETARCESCGWTGHPDDLIDTGQRHSFGIKGASMTFRRFAADDEDEGDEKEPTSDDQYEKTHPQSEPEDWDEDDDSNEKEARLLRAMAKASLQEQRAIALELDSLRKDRRHRRQAARDLDMASAHIRDCLTPVSTHALNTTATDWIGEVTDSDFDAVSDMDMQNDVVAQASLWYRRTSSEVRADREEFGEQAMGMARRTAGIYGERAHIARRAFLDHVAHLHRFAESGSELDADESGQGQSKLPHEVPLGGNEETFDEDFWSDDSAAVPSTRSPVIQENARRRTAGEAPEHLKEHQFKPKDGGDGDDDGGDDKPDWLKDKIEGRRTTATGDPGDWPLDKDTEQNPNVDDWFSDEDKQETGWKQHLEELPGVKSRRTQAAKSRNCENGNHSDCSGGSCSCSCHKTSPSRDYSGACADGDHDSCKMGSECKCPCHKTARRRTAVRQLSEIAREIRGDWGAKVNYAAVPYLEAMLELDSIDQMYYADPAKQIVSYFLSNSGAWRGETAARVKAELRAMLSGKAGAKTASEPIADESGQGKSGLPQVDETGGKDDRPMWPWELPEDDPESGNDAADVANVRTPGGEAGYPQPSNRSKQSAYNPLSDPESPYNNPNKGPHKGTPDDLFPDGVPLHGDLTPEQEAWLKGRKRSTIHTAEDDGGGQTCSVCGDAIERDPEHEDPQTWHHDNGETHDHEATPGGGDSKESRRVHAQEGSAAYAFGMTQAQAGEGMAQAFQDWRSQNGGRLSDQERDDIGQAFRDLGAINRDPNDPNSGGIYRLMKKQQAFRDRVQANLNGGR